MLRFVARYVPDNYRERSGLIGKYHAICHYSYNLPLFKPLVIMIKKLFSTRIQTGTVHFSLLLLRLASGGFMLTHGVPKLQRILSGEMKFGDPLGLGPEISLIMVVFAEFVCAILIMLGLGTRLASIPLIVTMAVAAFIAHGDDPFQRKELALFYLVVYVVLLLAGSGKYSVDRLISKK
jgi:putative oxidoreductase